MIATLPPTPGEIIAARTASGHSQADAAVVAGIGSRHAWYRYESGERAIDAARWALYLLATGQHPTHTLIERDGAAQDCVQRCPHDA